MKRYLFLFVLLLFGVQWASAQTGTIQGKVTDSKSNEPLIGATVKLFKTGVLATGTQTDLDGNYSIPTDPGTYDVEITYIGYAGIKIQGVVIKPNTTTFLDKAIEEDGGVELEGVVIKVERFVVPLMEKDVVSGGTQTAEDIKNMPTRNIGMITATTAGVAQKEEGEDSYARGGRSDANITFVDGVRVIGRTGLSPNDIEQVQVIIGGVPALYGDATGSVTNIVTKGPSSEYSGSLQAETSRFLDPYAASQIDLGLSGPILRRKIFKEDGSVETDADGKEVKETLLGFRLSGFYTNTKDSRPSALGSYRLNDDKLAALQANPLRKLGNGYIQEAQFIRQEDLIETKIRPNNASTQFGTSGKLDFRISKGMQFTLGGNINLERDRNAFDSYRLLNYDRNPLSRNLDWRASARFRHRIGADSEEASKGAFQNINYELQFDYNRITRAVQDEVHGDKLFNYGYIGKFKQNRVPVFTFDTLFVADTMVLNPDGTPVFANTHTAWSNQFVSYERGGLNPILENYNNVVDASQVKDIKEFVYRNGFQNQTFDDLSDLHTNVGQVYDTYQKSLQEQYGARITGGFDIVKPGTENRHQINFGIVFEQRIERSYTLNPFALWNTAELTANNYFTSGVNRLDSIGRNDTILNPVTGTFMPIYAPLLSGTPSYFAEQLRKKLGKGTTDYVNVYELSPDQLSLDMFSADQLFVGENRLGSYYGYDYKGNLLKEKNVDFFDFFKQKLNGVYTRNVAPNRPVYTAAYIQDKFTFKDIIIRAGIRFDRYDANTKVLRDPYTLYGAYTAGDIKGSNYKFDIPSTIGSDYAVYVDNPDKPADAKPVAFRNGDQWYSATGATVNDANLLFAGSRPYPALKSYSTKEDLQTENYKPEDAFTDYDPKVIVMPRLALSFPISDIAGFFAHYDVLSQRPPSNTIATALQYYNFKDRVADGVIFGNPNLRPQTTIDYQAGYQQKLTESSKFKISVYYREMRNLVQSRQYLNAYPVNYKSYGNSDFATSKGVSFEYDLRRTGNVRMTANYTLSFANGTGSNPSTSANLGSNELRNVFPLDFDQRHAFNVVLDYRFKDGSDYNGPRLFGSDFLANAGANFLIRAFSGSPYTKKRIPNSFTDGGGQFSEGSLNGARTPWNFAVDFRIDKDFEFAKDSKHPLALNVYLRIQNVLNTQNVLSVYPYTGSATDDGYLLNPFGRGPSQLASQLDPTSFQTLYNLRMNDPANISIPRRIFLGFSLGF